MQAQANASTNALEGLREIPLPAAVSWMPQTMGWYVLAGVLVVLGVWWFVVWFKRHKRNQYRRFALAELAAIRQALQSGATESIAKLPALVKRTALQAAPRGSVAWLSGTAWLSELDRSYGGTGFSAGPGQLLSVVAYEPSSNWASRSPSEFTQLLDVVEKWIRKHDGSGASD